MYKYLLLLEALFVAVGCSSRDTALSTGYTERFEMQAFKQCMNYGDSEACLNAGFRSEFNDANLAGQLFAKACMLDNIKGCTFGISIYQQQNENGIVKELAKKGCELNDAPACFELFYQLKDTNPSEAKLYFDKFCELDPANASDCEIIRKEQKKKRDILSSHVAGCKNGDSQECNMAGLDYSGLHNNESTSDYKLAIAYLSKGCKLNNKFACSNLGDLYLHAERDSKGFYLAKDTKKAFDLKVKACNLSNKVGCYDVGVMYHNGTGVRRNSKKSNEYFGKACDLGDQQGCDYYQEIEE